MPITRETKFRSTSSRVPLVRAGLRVAYAGLETGHRALRERLGKRAEIDTFTAGVQGVIEGRSIESSHDVEIGESGKVTASISAKVVRIAGEVTGDINGTEKVLISKSGRVQGNVTAPRVQLEDGALFRGSIDMNPAKAAESKPAPVASAPAGAKAAVVDAGARKEPGLTLKSG